MLWSACFQAACCRSNPSCSKQGSLSVNKHTRSSVFNSVPERSTSQHLSCPGKITPYSLHHHRYHHVALFQAAAPLLASSCSDLAAVSLGRALHAYSTVHHHDQAMCLALAAEVHDRVVGLTHRSLFSLLSRVRLGPGPAVVPHLTSAGGKSRLAGSAGLTGVGGGGGGGSLKVRDTASVGGLDLAGGLASREFLLLDLCR